MFPVVLGALAGAGALFAFAHLSEKQDEEKNGGVFDAASLDAQGVRVKLDVYFWQASKLYQRCNDLTIKAGGMLCPAIDLPDDDLPTKIGNRLYDVMTPVSRAGLVSQLKDINNDCLKLLGKFAGAFKKANAILEKNGQTPVLIQKKHVDSSGILVNNAMSNEDWDSDFEAQVDKVRDFIEASYNAADKLIEALRPLQDASDDVPDSSLDAICA